MEPRYGGNTVGSEAKSYGDTHIGNGAHAHLGDVNINGGLHLHFHSALSILTATDCVAQFLELNSSLLTTGPRLSDGEASTLQTEIAQIFDLLRTLPIITTQFAIICSQPKEICYDNIVEKVRLLIPGPVPTWA